MFELTHWFLRNPIAAKLLMVAILIGGYIGAKNVAKEAFPTTEQNFITVSMSYPGANPSEVEQQIVVRIEEALSGLIGVFKLTSESKQGFGTVTVEVIDGYDTNFLLNEIKARVDAINTFPGRAERPVVKQTINNQVLMYISLYGDVDHSVLKSYAYQIRDEMVLLDGIARVTYTGAKEDQLNIEISENTLRHYNLTFDQVAQAIRRSSLDLSAGSIRTEQGSIQLQTLNQADKADDFSRIPIISRADGSQVFLGDIASIHDGFSDLEMEEVFAGKPAINLQLYLDSDPELMAGTLNAREYLKNLGERLPSGMKISINYEIKELFDSRLTLLTDNALGGLALVFVILMLFLRPMLAVWVCVGIVTAFAGALWLMPVVGISINMLSMFGFLIVLGIVVDDAIVVGESIYARQQAGEKGIDSALIGTQMVLKPVILAVLSTVLFFTPILDVPTESKPFTVSIFYVITLSLLFSLVETLLILPSHLSHMKPERESQFYPLQMLSRIRASFAGKLSYFAVQYYQPLLSRLLHLKLVTIVSFSLLFFLSLSLLLGGWINKQFLPHVPNSFININVTLPNGSPYSDSLAISQRIRAAVAELRVDKELLAANGNEPFVTNANYGVIDNQSNTFVGFTSPEVRTVSVDRINNRLKELIGPIPEAQNYTLGFAVGGYTPDISLNMNILSNRRDDQERAVVAIKQALNNYTGVSNVQSSLVAERPDIDVTLKPQAEIYGVSASDIAQQVRQAFYGEEIQRIPRAKEDVRVMLRYPEQDRRELEQLHNMRIRTRDNIEVPLETVAEIKFVPGFTTINRLDRRRNITITADVDDNSDASEIVADLLSANEVEWQQRFPGLNIGFDGTLKAQAEFGASFGKNYMFILAIVYALLAIAFRSYFEPLIVLSAVPFGYMGMALGHLILGHSLTMMSAFGFLACSGVVINDNLVLLDRINALRREGASAFDAAYQAGVDRFRPILLTSFTTFFGLMPILFESSGQAQFLIPMVISLAFGVLLATPITLIFVPTLYLLGCVVGERIQTRYVVIKRKLGVLFTLPDNS